MINLEEGKHYRTADGKKVGPMLFEAGFWHQDGCGQIWNGDGTVMTENGDESHDYIVAEWEDYKTLRELDLKPGDVVECVYNAGSSFVIGKQYTCVAGKDGFGRNAVGPINPKGQCIPTPDTEMLWRIVSRASRDGDPKPWDAMSDEEKGALLLASHEGRAIECFDDGEWFSISKPRFVPHAAYRVRPEPKREAVTLHGAKFEWEQADQPCPEDTHRITFDIVDGEPDCDTIKMEKIT